VSNKEFSQTLFVVGCGGQKNKIKRISRPDSFRVIMADAIPGNDWNIHPKV
jgi:hypothetical protein